MHTPPRDRRRQPQPWYLTGLAGSPAAVRETERRLARERGHEPSLREVVEDLMERRRLATSFTGPVRRASDAPDGSTA